MKVSQDANGALSLSTLNSQSQNLEAHNSQSQSIQQLNLIEEEQEDDAQSNSTNGKKIPKTPEPVREQSSQRNAPKGMNRGQIFEKLKSLLFLVQRMLKRIVSLVFNSDILHILRPFVYVYLVMKHGKKSWYPVQVSLAMDLLIIFLVFLKLIGAQKLRTIERRDLTRRNVVSLLKYFIRDPIFENFTLKVLQKVFSVLRIPDSLFGILLSILNYYRYYTYIA